MTEIEKLVCTETPTTREEIGTTMTALRKPLKMWPGLYTILGPISKLLDPDAPFEWGEEQSKAWAQAKKYVLKEFSPYTDSKSDGGSGSSRARHEKRNLTGADLQNLGMSDTRPKKFMTPEAMSQAKEEQRPEPGQTDGAGRQQVQWCLQCLI